MLQTAWDEAINAKDNKVYVIKSITGLGKTRLLETLPDTGYTIGFNTHQLKNEVKNRLNNDNFAVTPDTLDGLPDRIQSRINYLYNTGLSDRVSSVIKKFKKTLDKSDPLYQKIEDYHRMNRIAYDTDSTVLTTHKKMLASNIDSNKRVFNFKADTYIFDEDPLHNILEIDRVKSDDFSKVIQLLPSENSLNKAFQDLRKWVDKNAPQV